MNDPLGDTVTGSMLPAGDEHASSSGLLWLFAAGCATSAPPRAANERRISEITSPQPLLVSAATVRSVPAMSALDRVRVSVPLAGAARQAGNGNGYRVSLLDYSGPDSN
jgi:hypothetical protein